MILFPRWNPHSFALITLAVYAYTHAFHDSLSPEPAHLAGPSAHTRSRPTTINFTPHPSLSSSLCSKSSQSFLSLIWTLISMLYNFTLFIVVHAHILHAHNVSCLALRADFVVC
jgi:hypothetical protein